MGMKLPIVPIASGLVLLVLLAGIGYFVWNRGSQDDGEGPGPSDDNRAPTAMAGYDKVVEPGEEFTLDGKLSSDPDGDELTFSWDLDDSTDSDMDGDPSNDADLSGMSVKHTYPVPTETKTYRVVLNVSDGKRHDTDTVVLTVFVSDDLEPPMVNLTCHYTRPPTPIPGVSPQYVLTVESVSRTETLMNYSYVLLDPENAVLQEGGLIDLVTAPPNATLRYVDLNPRYADLSAGDSVTAKDVASIPEGSVLEIYFRTERDPSGAVTLTKSP